MFLSRVVAGIERTLPHLISGAVLVKVLFQYIFGLSGAAIVGKVECIAWEERMCRFFRECPTGTSRPDNMTRFRDRNLTG